MVWAPRAGPARVNQQDLDTDAAADLTGLCHKAHQDGWVVDLPLHHGRQHRDHGTCASVFDVLQHQSPEEGSQARGLTLHRLDIHHGSSWRTRSMGGRTGRCLRWGLRRVHRLTGHINRDCWFRDFHIVVQSAVRVRLDGVLNVISEHALEQNLTQLELTQVPALNAIQHQRQQVAQFALRSRDQPELLNRNQQVRCPPAELLDLDLDFQALAFLLVCSQCNGPLHRQGDAHADALR